jgi:hypothetical protein
MNFYQQLTDLVLPSSSVSTRMIDVERLHLNPSCLTRCCYQCKERYLYDLQPYIRSPVLSLTTFATLAKTPLALSVTL